MHPRLLELAGTTFFVQLLRQCSFAPSKGRCARIAVPTRADDAGLCALPACLLLGVCDTISPCFPCLIPPELRLPQVSLERMGTHSLAQQCPTQPILCRPQSKTTSPTTTVPHRVRASLPVQHPDNEAAQNRRLRFATRRPPTPRASTLVTVARLPRHRTAAIPHTLRAKLDQSIPMPTLQPHFLVQGALL